MLYPSVSPTSRLLYTTQHWWLEPLLWPRMKPCQPSQPIGAGQCFEFSTMICSLSTRVSALFFLFSISTFTVLLACSLQIIVRILFTALTRCFDVFFSGFRRKNTGNQNTSFLCKWKFHCVAAGVKNVKFLSSLSSIDSSVFISRRLTRATGCVGV